MTAMAHEYRRYGLGWRGPGLDKLHARRVVRRKSRQSQAFRFIEKEYWDPKEQVFWEPDYDDNEVVTWRMTQHPFRLVPTWVRLGAEEDYENERACWALAQDPLCWQWGVPAADCEAMRDFLFCLSLVFSDDWAQPHWGSFWVRPCLWHG